MSKQTHLNNNSDYLYGPTSFMVRLALWFQHAIVFLKFVNEFGNVNAIIHYVSLRLKCIILILPSPVCHNRSDSSQNVFCRAVGPGQQTHPLGRSIQWECTFIFSRKRKSLLNSTQQCTHACLMGIRDQSSLGLYNIQNVHFIQTLLKSNAIHYSYNDMC